MTNPWTPEEIKALEEKFQIKAGHRHAGGEDYHFPRHSFLTKGYATPGGYVKDLSIIWHDGRLHLFHIDGRPGEICWITGNEISFGHASSSDLCHWIRHTMPLAIGQSSWESEHVWAPYIYRRSDTFYLFYMGSGPGESFISYATSRDLEKWTRWAGGPIRSAMGRDPFVYDDGDRSILLYTALGGARVAACASQDMVTWEPLPDLLEIPGGMAAESPSLHRLKNGYVLWFNDYRANLEGFRAAYVFSGNPHHFDPAEIREFEFHSELPDVTPSLELGALKAFPLSIELVECRGMTWLVAYFRWQGDRNRFYFGELDWSCEPAIIREISVPEKLQKWLGH